MSIEYFSFQCQDNYDYYYLLLFLGTAWLFSLLQVGKNNVKLLILFFQYILCKTAVFVKQGMPF